MAGLSQRGPLWPKFYVPLVGARGLAPLFKGKTYVVRRPGMTGVS